jgi:23S rRNA (cytosine1962-C5)-methyltransferase
MNGTVVIKKGREKPILQQHPWIFSGAIARAENAAPGDIVTVLAQDGSFLARGYWNPKSQIQVRILTWKDEEINEDWWRRMLKRAIEARHSYHWWHKDYKGDSYGYRLINAENDFIPGLIVDRYGTFLVLQALTLYVDRQKTLIAQLLVNLLEEFQMPIRGIYERSDVDVRRKEGLESYKGILWGEEPPEYVAMTHGKLIRLVDIHNGHKTGYYLDQLQNQDFLTKFLSSVNLFDPTVRLLNLFSYTGGFGVGTPCHVVNVDSSREALELAEETYKLAYFPEEEVEFIQADVFQYLRDIAEQGERFDVVILDPPKFASSAQQVAKAARGYKDINLNAFKVVKSGGYLMTFSCSGAVSADLFQKIVFGALADSGRQAQILRHLGPGDDHPVALTFPEGAYLKGLLLRVY